MEIKAAIYCRVSTEEQGNNGTSLDSQKEACINKASELGYGVPDSLVFKESYSGLTLDRPCLDRLRQLVRDKAIACVIAYTTDRISRDPVQFIILQEEMEKANVQLILVTETLDSSDIGKLISHIRGYAAKLESEKIKERTMRGKRMRAKEGRLPQGTGVGLYGYSWDKVKKRRRVIEFEAKVVNQVFEMIANGKSRFHVAKTLNDNGVPTKSCGHWHPLTIQRMIINTAYIGMTYFGKTHRNGKGSEDVPEEQWQLLKKATPAIISKDLFERANKALKRSKELHLGSTQNEYLLTGFIKCGLCGNHLVGSCLHHKYKYYHCRGTYPYVH